MVLCGDNRISTVISGARGSVSLSKFVLVTVFILGLLSFLRNYIGHSVVSAQGSHVHIIVSIMLRGREEAHTEVTALFLNGSVITWLWRLKHCLWRRGWMMTGDYAG